MPDWIVTLIIALSGIGVMVLRIVGARNGAAPVRKPRKLAPQLAGIVFLLMLVPLAIPVLVAHRHGHPIDGRFWFLLVLDVAGLVVVGVALIRRKSINPVLTDEERASAPFGIAFIVGLVVVFALGFFHAKLGL